MTEPAGTGEAEELRLAPALAGQLLVAPVRLAAGLVGLVAALLRGLDGGPALVAFALGALGFAVVMLSAERYFLQVEEPDPLPAGATVQSLGETLRAAVWPSTVGVSVLLVVAVAANPTLAALLAGVLAGMGIAALFGAGQTYLSQRTLGGRLLVDRTRKQVYIERRECMVPSRHSCSR
jgi:hypothetical protein